MITPNATQEGAGRMTLAQLKYVVTVAKAGTMTEAAKELFISQPSLTKSIKELEKEMHVRIFDRTNKGIVVSKDGEEFLAYARQVLEQAELLEEKYMNKSARKQEFCVSTQHYSFAVNAFVDLIKEYGQDDYDFSLRETQTYEIIDDVAKMRSELGILFLNEFNEVVLTKILKSHDLSFHPLFTARPHVFVSRSHHSRRIQSLPMKNWKPILISLLSRENTIRFIFRKKSFLLLNAEKISASGIEQLYSIY